MTGVRSLRRKHANAEERKGFVFDCLLGRVQERGFKYATGMLCASREERGETGGRMRMRSRGGDVKEETVSEID